MFDEVSVKFHLAREVGPIQRILLLPSPRPAAPVQPASLPVMQWLMGPDGHKQAPAGQAQKVRS